MCCPGKGTIARVANPPPCSRAIAVADIDKLIRRMCCDTRRHSTEMGDQYCRDLKDFSITEASGIGKGVVIYDWPTASP